MFGSCLNFNQPMLSWDVGQVTTMNVRWRRAQCSLTRLPTTWLAGPSDSLVCEGIKRPKGNGHGGTGEGSLHKARMDSPSLSLLSPRFCCRRRMHHIRSFPMHCSSLTVASFLFYCHAQACLLASCSHDHHGARLRRLTPRGVCVCSPSLHRSVCLVIALLSTSH